MFVYFAEKFPQASSYRSEILGDIAAQLILSAVTRNTSAQYQEIPMCCDDKRVLNYSIKAERELKEKQAQFDVLCGMKGPVSDSPVSVFGYYC